MSEVEACLVLFDRRSGRTWEEKLHEKTLEAPSGRKIHCLWASARDMMAEIE